MEQFNDKGLDDLLGITSENQLSDTEKTKVDNAMKRIIDSAIPKILFDANSEEKDEMRKSLEDKLSYIYKDSIKHLVINGIEEDIEILLEQIVSKWNKKTIEEKRMELLRDVPAENIISISNKAWEMAIQRIKTGKIYDDENLYNEMIDAFEKNKNNVKEFNITQIEECISEGILDLKFAFGKTENMSLRVGRYK